MGNHISKEVHVENQGPLSKEAKIFLLSVAKNPNRMSSEVSRDLKTMQGKQIRDYLQAKGLITVTQGRSRAGRPAMFLRPTKQGLEILGLELPETNDSKNLSAAVSPSTLVKAMQEPDPNCTHHWIIEPAAGPLSRGKCENCHGESEFKNWVETLHNPMASPGI